MTEKLPWLAAIAAILVRIPFLVKADAFFNADEAVHGLMAHHLDEFPIVLWGQGYKGVPEVYLESAIFALFGNGIVQLKLVSLVVWGAGTGAITRLAQIWHGATGAIIAALLMVIGPAALVPWTLSGDVASTWMSVIVAMLLIEFQKALDASLPGIPPRVWFWCALGLWIHPVAACLFAAVAAAGVVRSRARRDREALANVLLARQQAAIWRVMLLVLHIAIALLVLIFVYTFAGGEIDFGPIRASHPQRSIRAIAILTALAVLGHAWQGSPATRRRTLVSLAWLGAGLAPIVVQILVHGGFGTPVITRRLADMPWIVRGVGTDILPLVAGVRDVHGGGLGLSWWAAVPLVAAISLYAASFVRALLSRNAAERQLAALFPGFALLAVFGLLTLGGGFSGPPSVRYLFCFYGLVTIVAADGFTRLFRWHRAAGSALVIVCVATFGFGEVRWWKTLSPDPSPAAMIQCLEAGGRRVGVADYWIAYPLTFIANERVLVVPDNPAEDRYEPYRKKVDAAADPVKIMPAVEIPDASTEPALCRTPRLRAN